jgi:hypothetical protein
MGMQDELNRAQAKLNRVARKECVGCGGTEWATPTARTVFMPTITPDGRIDPANGIASIALVCKTCGFVRLHDVKTLQR